MQQSEKYKYMFDVALLSRAQDLILMRKGTNLSQLDMAFRCGVSIKTIQRFETMKAANAYLCFAYKQILVESGQSTCDGVQNLLKNKQTT